MKMMTKIMEKIYLLKSELETVPGTEDENPRKKKQSRKLI